MTEFDNPGQYASGRFNTTHWSVVLEAGSGESGAAALEKLCRAYWHPLYYFARRKGHNDADAKDLTQQFFAALLQRNDLARVDPARGRFRTFLLTAFTHFLANEYDRASALKRGGGKAVLSLDALPEEQLQFEHSDVPAGEAFDREWGASILVRALQALKTEFEVANKLAQFNGLKRFLTFEGTAADYSALAMELALAPSSVAVMVHRLRQRFRELVRQEVAQTVSTPAELSEEMGHLFHTLCQ